MRTSLRQTAIATTAIIALSAFAAAAAPAGDPTATRPSPTASGQSATKDHPGIHHNMAGKVEQRITDLHAKLHITPAQQPQWDQFIQVMRDNAKTMETLIKARSGHMMAMNAVDDFKSYSGIADAHADGLKKFIPVFEPLYVSMSDTQKKNADALFHGHGRVNAKAKAK